MDTKKLRQKILDLAIRGKLVPQDPNDEPASVLLERIRAEKEQLIKEGKIKRSKKSAATDKSHYENVPFEIPVNWVWTILGNIGEIITGTTPSKDNKEYYGGNIPFYKPTDLDGGIMTNYALDTLTDVGYEQCRKLPSESVLVTCIGATIGKVGVIRVAGACNQQINAIIPSTIVDYRYLYYALTSDFLQREILEHSSSTTLPIINKGKFSELPFPLPSLGEQNRIVIEVEKWLDFIADIEAEKDELESHIKKTKSKILDLAITGKLVPQDPNDEPAIELLKRINPDFQPCDNSHYGNLPFELPDGWCWATLGSIGKWQSGATPSRMRKDYYGGDIPWLKTGDLNDWYITDIPEYITQQALNETSVKLNPAGSILIAMYGATIGKIGILTMPATTNQACCACISHNGIEQMYLFYYLLSHKEEFVRRGGGGAQPNISKEKIVETLIPIPPLSEQLRIIKAIEAIFNKIDNITAELS